MSLHDITPYISGGVQDTQGLAIITESQLETKQM